MRTTNTHSRRRFSRGVQVVNTRRITLLAAAGLIALGLIALAGCGSNTSPGITYTPPVVTPAVTVTPGAQYAYLYSRVDYPLQIPVGSGDTVTLTLSTQNNILTVTPAAGSGSTTVGAPISLPTALQFYQDIGAEADTVDTARSPVVWQLQSPPRQTLLTAAGVTPRQYQSEVTFHWHVQAIGAGVNSMNVVLRLYYIYLDGSEHDGSIEITQSPIPMLAVQPSPISSSLPSVKLPLAGITWLAGFIAVLRFVWKAYQTINTVAEPVKQAAEVAVAVKKRMAGSGTQEQPASNGYPNPWAQPQPWQSAPMSPGATEANDRGRSILPPSPSSSPLSSWPPVQPPPPGPPQTPRAPDGW